MDFSDFLKNPTQVLNNIEGFVQSVINQYIVRPTGSGVGIGGFVFSIRGNEEVAMDAEITDHYVEENYAIQDHIALRPERVVLRGYVGELTDSFIQNLLSVIQTVDRLGILNDLLPNFTQQALQVYSTIFNAIGEVNNVIQQAGNLYDLFNLLSGSETINQKNAFNYFYSLWQSRQVFSVQTPYGVIDNMAIENVRAFQHEETIYQSDFSVTFKKIRTAKTIVSIIPTPTWVNNIFSGRSYPMISSIKDFGNERGSDLESGANITWGNDSDGVSIEVPA